MAEGAGGGGGGLLNKVLIGEAPSRGLYLPFLTEEVPLSYYLPLTNGISFTYLGYNFASSETQGQIVGARESLKGRKNKARRKVQNGEKSPWGQSLIRPVPNGRRRSGF